jgi:hypothetical protein
MHRSPFNVRVGAKEALGCCSRAQPRGVSHKIAGQVANKLVPLFFWDVQVWPYAAHQVETADWHTA